MKQVFIIESKNGMSGLELLSRLLKTDDKPKEAWYNVEEVKSE